jgi:hypothetical protein
MLGTISFGDTERGQVGSQFHLEIRIPVVRAKSLLLHTYAEAELSATFIFLAFISKVNALYNSVS